MPEGDTLYRIAENIRPVFTNKTVVAATAWRPRSGPPIDADSLVGRQVQSVKAVGKHLMIAFDDARVLHSHLGMTGAWHVYALGQPWAKPAELAAITLATDEHIAVNFTPKHLELTTAAKLRGDAYLRRLGPDMMLPETDVRTILPRLRTHNARPIGEAVMNQTIAAGIGNIYKSESLFLAQLNPWRLVGDIDDDALLAYLTLTKKLMHRNRGRGMRTIRFAASGPRMWVYSRTGEPCLKCGTEIQMRRQGEQGRSTYWCGGCQA